MGFLYTGKLCAGQAITAVHRRDENGRGMPCYRFFLWQPLFFCYFMEMGKRYTEPIAKQKRGGFSMSVLQSPFRYDYVGSFLRPEALKKARAEFAVVTGTLTLYGDFRV